MRMSNKLKNVYLAENTLSISNVTNFIFFQYFDGDIFASDFVGAKLNLAKGAFSECFADDVVAKLFSVGFLIFLIFLHLSLFITSIIK